MGSSGSWSVEEGVGVGASGRRDQVRWATGSVLVSCAGGKVGVCLLVVTFGGGCVTLGGGCVTLGGGCTTLGGR